LCVEREGMGWDGRMDGLRAGWQARASRRLVREKRKKSQPSAHHTSPFCSPTLPNTSLPGVARAASVRRVAISEAGDRAGARDAGARPAGEADAAAAMDRAGARGARAAARRTTVAPDAAQRRVAAMEEEVFGGGRWEGGKGRKFCFVLQNARVWARGAWAGRPVFCVTRERKREKEGALVAAHTHPPMPPRSYAPRPAGTDGTDFAYRETVEQSACLRA
jgi:hypothetical protein